MAFLAENKCLLRKGEEFLCKQPGYLGESWVKQSSVTKTLSKFLSDQWPVNIDMPFRSGGAVSADFYDVHSI